MKEFMEDCLQLEPEHVNTPLLSKPALEGKLTLPRFQAIDSG